MVTVLIGGLALFSLAVGGVLALLRSRTAALSATGLACILAVTFIAFAIIGDRRERRCVDRLPELPRINLPEEYADLQRKADECEAGEVLGVDEPF